MKITHYEIEGFTDVEEFDDPIEPDESWTVVFYDDEVES